MADLDPGFVAKDCSGHGIERCEEGAKEGNVVWIQEVWAAMGLFPDALAVMSLEETLVIGNTVFAEDESGHPGEGSGHHGCEVVEIELGN